jgi:hypothetical protein
MVCSPRRRAPRHRSGPWTGTSHRRSAIIRLGLLPALPRAVPGLRPCLLIPSVRFGQRHRDPGAPAPGAHPRTSAPRTYAVSLSRSGDPRCAQPCAASNPVAVLPGHPRPLLRWLREAAQHKWRRWRKQRGPDRPPMSDALVRLIGGLGRENRRQRCVRIQGELRKLRMVTSKSRSTRISSTEKTPGKRELDGIGDIHQ